MKCNRCGFVNIEGAEFCGNCGNKLPQNYSKSITNNQQPVLNKTKIKKQKILIFGIIITVILTIIVITLISKKSNSFDDPFENVDDISIIDTSNSAKGFNENLSFSKKIEDDYKNGVLSTDEYIMQLAYSIYDNSKIDSKYKSLNLDYGDSTKFFETFGNLIDELSDDTVKYVFNKYTLSDVKWDVPEKSNENTSLNNLVNEINTYNVKPLVNDKWNVSKLNEVKLSNNGNFLIYYTKEGFNAITDEKATKIAEFLENIVSQYKSKYNLDFNYEARLDQGVLNTMTEVVSFGLFSTAQSKAYQLLKNNNIDSQYLKTAMPVYIVDTDKENSHALGRYSAPVESFPKILLRICDIFGENGAGSDNISTTYSFPFFVVSSRLDDFNDTKIVVAHELFHHYQRYICGDGNYGECVSGNFTLETTADLMSAKVSGINKIGTAINKHAGSYINDVESSIDKIGYKYNGNSGLGYGAFVFASNYIDIVNNGFNYMMNSLKTVETLKYLYDNSGGKYKDVMVTTGIKNLTLEYDNKLFIGTDDGKIVYPPSHNIISIDDNKQLENLNYSSIHYYYLNPNNYGINSQISFSSNSKDLTLLLFIKENNTYKHLYNHNVSEEFIININDFANYDEIAFAVVNSAITDTATYNIEINNKGGRKPTVTPKTLKIKTSEDKMKNTSSFTCYNIEDDGEYKTILQIKLDFDKKDKIDNMYFKGTIQIKEQDSDDPTFSIAQKVVSGLINVMQQTYEKQFKSFKVKTQESKDKYSVTFKITKDYYKALKNSINITSKNKIDIIKSMKKEGYTCEYNK